MQSLQQHLPHAPGIQQNQLAAFHLFEGLQQVTEAAEERVNQAENELIYQLREALRQIQEVNQTLQESRDLEARRASMLSKNITTLNSQYLTQMTALQEQINAMQMRAQTDAARISELEGDLKNSKKIIAQQKPLCDSVQALLDM